MNTHNSTAEAQKYTKIWGDILQLYSKQALYALHVTFHDQEIAISYVRQQALYSNVYIVQCTLNQIYATFCFEFYEACKNLDIHNVVKIK